MRESVHPKKKKKKKKKRVSHGTSTQNVSLVLQVQQRQVLWANKQRQVLWANKQRQALGEKPSSHTHTSKVSHEHAKCASSLVQTKVSHEKRKNERTCKQTRQGASRHLHKIKSHSHPLCTHVSHASPCKSIVSHVLTCNSRLRAKTRYDAAH